MFNDTPRCPRCGSQFLQRDFKNMTIRCLECSFDSSTEVQRIVANTPLTIDESTVSSLNVGYVNNIPQSENTLQIHTDKIIFHHKDLDIDIPIDSERFANFNNIIINGIKFTRIDKVD